jgi:amidase/aspartyl-tRNA(Asn)/glutamyl-tRNA(Gln) amidotransferase subunit A
MTFRDWQQLSPADAAHELHRRVQDRLSPEQQRAVIAHLPSEAELTRSFAAAPPETPLRGVPYFLKDLFPVAGQPMFAGSTFLPEVRPAPTQDSVMVQKLRAAGAVLVGRTHLQEFAYGITGENPHYGDCMHPRFPGHLTGGSSSGSAAIVAAGIVPLAVGSDTGGSIRIPAAFCGLYGFRLTPHDPFIADAFPLAPSYDTAGWFTATAADMATTLASLVGVTTAQRKPQGRYAELPELDPDVALACANAASRLATGDGDGNFAAAAMGDSVDTYNTVVAGEAWQVHQAWAERFRDRYDPAVWQRLNRVHGITGEQRDTARQSTEKIKRLWSDYFRTSEFLVLAASPFAALTKAECTLENRTRILAVTTPASIGGYPVLTVPVALPSGLTTGLQVVVRSVDSPAIGWALGKFTI